MTDSCNGFMPIHALEGLLGLPVKALAVRAAELGPRMIASVHGQRESVGVFPEQANNLWSASSPVPWNECDVGTKVVSLHEGQKFLKVHKTVAGLQHRIIDHQAGVC